MSPAETQIVAKLYCENITSLNKYARRLYRAEDKDDFVQFALERICKELKVLNYGYYLTDYFRKHKIPRARYKAKGKDFLNQKNITAKPADIVKLPCIAPIQEKVALSKIHINKIKTNMKKIAYKLSTYHGFTNKDIAELFDVHETTVCRWKQ